MSVRVKNRGDGVWEVDVMARAPGGKPRRLRRRVRVGTGGEARQDPSIPVFTRSFHSKRLDKTPRQACYLLPFH